MSGETMRHNCDSHGCFLKKHVLKFNVFCDIFPRGINFSDVDGIVEYGGKFLMMEWKRDLSTITKGQSMLAHEWVKHDKFMFIYVLGNADDMSCTWFQPWYGGEKFDWIKGNIEVLKMYIDGWRQLIENGDS